MEIVIFSNPETFSKAMIGQSGNPNPEFFTGNQGVQTSQVPLYI